jgi:hypothetical protein
MMSMSRRIPSALISLLVLPATSSEATAQCFLQRLQLSSPAVGDRFGSSLAVWDSSLAVGANGEAAPPPTSGSIRVFSRNGCRTWTESAVFRRPPSEFESGIGRTVALGSTTLMIGASAHQAAYSAGAVYAYECNGSL